jgi:hypothetical protein
MPLLGKKSKSPNIINSKSPYKNMKITGLLNGTFRAYGFSGQSFLTIMALWAGPFERIGRSFLNAMALLNIVALWDGPF